MIFFWVKLSQFLFFFRHNRGLAIAIYLINQTVISDKNLLATLQTTPRREPRGGNQDQQRLHKGSQQPRPTSFSTEMSGYGTPPNMGRENSGQYEGNGWARAQSAPSVLPPYQPAPSANYGNGQFANHNILKQTLRRPHPMADQDTLSEAQSRNNGTNKILIFIYNMLKKYNRFRWVF